MIRSVKFNDNTIEYELQRKRVKNINLRVKSDGSVVVSANNRVSAQYIDSFVESKGEFILKAINGFDREAATPQYSSEELNKLIISLFEKTYNDFVQFNIERPKLKFRKMNVFLKIRFFRIRLCLTIWIREMKDVMRFLQFSRWGLKRE